MILFFLAANPNCTMRELSLALNVTARRIDQIIRDLAEVGLLSVTRVGRRNTYSVNRQASFDHPTLAHITLGQFEEALAAGG